MIPKFRIHEKKVHFATKIGERCTPDTLFIKKFAEILLFLRNFGRLITSLKFSANTFSKQNAAKVASFIEKYCSVSLVELEIIQDIHLIIGTRKTFNRVTKLKLAHWKESNFEALDQVFPVLEEITLETYNPIPPSLIRRYSNVKRLDLLGIYATNFTEDGVRAFVVSNQQLRALSMERVPSYELLKYISEILTHLDSLAFRYSSKIISAFPEVIHFDSVKNLSITLFEVTPRDSNPMMNFNQLDSLEIITYKISSVPIQLIQQQNASLKSILFTDLQGSDVIRILSQCGPFQALEEVRLHWEDTHEVDRLLTEFETLKKITFLWMKLPYEPLEFDVIKTKLQGDWRFVECFLAKHLAAYDLYHVVISRQRNKKT